MRGSNAATCFSGLPITAGWAARPDRLDMAARACPAARPATATGQLTRPSTLASSSASLSRDFSSSLIAGCAGSPAPGWGGEATAPAARFLDACAPDGEPGAAAAGAAAAGASAGPAEPSLGLFLEPLGLPGPGRVIAACSGAGHQATVGPGARRCPSHLLSQQLGPGGRTCYKLLGLLPASSCCGEDTSRCRCKSVGAPVWESTPAARQPRSGCAINSAVRLFEPGGLFRVATPLPPLPRRAAAKALQKKAVLNSQRDRAQRCLLCC